MCFGCSKELSHRDSYFEYQKHMFWLRNKKNNFQLHTLNWRPEQAKLSLAKSCALDNNLNQNFFSSHRQ